MHKYLSILFLFNLIGCSEIQEHSLRRPDHIHPLKKELKEISGLSFVNPKMLVAVQDENGFIFRLNFDNFEKGKKIDFGKKGDYEGITNAFDRYYILKSNGHIISVNLAGKDKIVYKPDFKDKIEFEGLCFDKKNNQLLILCKNHPSKKKNKYINVYSFDLSKKEFAKKPFIKVNKKEAGIYNANGLLPSGIAINPIDGYIYIVSSIGKKLIVLDQDGKYVHYYNLDKTIYIQPEGLSFSENGELYIASEGKSGKAQVMHFISIP